MTRIEDTQARLQQQLDFFIRTSTPPAEMVFFEGDPVFSNCQASA